jgi:DNA mismatch repair protein MutL
MTAFWQETPVGYDARTLAPADKSLTPTEASDQPALAAHSDLAAAPDLAARLKALRPLGQIHRSYIVADSPEGLCIIDQHAAHERIFYERLLFTASPEKPQVQPLLFPVTMDLAPAQMAVWEDHRELLATAGFVIEPFGGKTLLVHGIPMALGETMAAPIVLDLIERLLYTESSGTNPTDPIAKRSEILAALAACKAAIKARESLTGEEMSALIAQLAACRSPATCPHGRPTMIAISVSELEKQFKRT